MAAFEPVPSKVDFPELEAGILDFWREQRVFERAQAQNQEGELFVFHEGPPTANGLPGVHHVLARAFKDCFLRYQQMRGRRVRRRAGWDTHGLPVELEVERSLKLKSKQEIERFGVEAFNRLCRSNVDEYIDVWERLTERIGFWVDLARAYRTCDTGYIESVWWSLKEIHRQGWLFRGHRVAPYCPRCQTSLSSHELAQPGAYKDVPDPGVTVRFRLKDRPDTSLLAWTTTPWTLPGNLALAVGPEIAYVEVAAGNERLVLARDRTQVLQGQFEVVREMAGQEMVGWRYQPIFPYLPEQPRAWQVLAADFVATDEGTGIVHTAGAYGEDDLKLCQEAGIEVRHTVGLDGRFLPHVQEFAGRFAKEADPEVTADLRERGLLYREEQIVHSYPFCWRCDTPLLYYALDSWFIRTTAVKERLLQHNGEVRWVPSHLRDGRMGNWLETLQDWNLSRARYWGTPLPIWICGSCGEERCVGSLAELSLGPDADLHKPFIDEVTLSCECGGEMRRVPEVIDCWYDSGAMPFAQWHYPFENQQEFQESHPADFISEGLDQTRGWFYTLLAEAVMLFDEPAYRNVVVPSLVVDEQGRKMAKSRGNVVDPEELIKRTSADAVRWWFYTTVTVGLEYRISQARVQEGAVRFLNLLWNTQSFFVTYANLAQWSPGQSDPAAPATVLERWIRARLEETVGHVVAALDQYDANSACRAIATLVDDTSTWYLRRSRSRFRGTPQEVAAACATLHLVLSRLALLIAPFTPFIAEAIYRELTPGAGTAGSVHLARYPEPDRAAPDIDLIGQMRVVRRLAEEGRKEREGHGVPLRQPLALAEVRGVELGDELAQVLAQELNVEEVRCAASAIGPAPSVALDFTLTPELRRRGWLRSFGHQLQELRRRSGLSPGDPIEVRHFSESEQAAEALEAGRNQIQDLCFARSLLRVGSREELDGGFSPWTELKLAPDPIWVAIRRIPPEAQ